MFLCVYVDMFYQHKHTKETKENFLGLILDVLTLHPPEKTTCGSFEMSH